MARIRTIKPEFPQSESMGKVSREARLLFLLLFTVVDDGGRTRAASRLLASLLYPYDEDAPNLITAWLDELEAEGCIHRYLIESASYLQITKWRDHQKIDKPTPSKLPAPPPIRERSDSPREDSRSVVVGSGSGSGEEGKGREGREEGSAHAAWRDVTECDPEAYQAWLAYRQAENDSVPELVRLSHAKWLGGIQPPERQRELVATCIRLRFKQLRDPNVGGRFPNGSAANGRKTYDDYARESETRLAALPGDDPGPM